MYSTFAEILNIPETNFAGGEKGGEDSSSVLKAWKGATLNARCMFFNDHKEAKDHAVVAFRADDPYVCAHTEDAHQERKWIGINT